MTEIHDKLDRMIETLSEIKVTQATQAVDLAHHIKRTDLLEERVEQVRAEIKPVVDHVTGLRFMVRLLGIAATVVAIVTGIYEIAK